MFGQANLRLFLATSGVFIVLNTIENFIHFTIGRNVNNKDKLVPLKFEMPSTYDLIKIVGVMLIFAFLQGFFTCYVQNCFRHIF